MDINCCVFSGRLTADAERHETKSGNAVVTFSLAVSDVKKDEWGEKGYIEYANFVNFVMFGNYAKALFAYLKKGVSISVVAKLHQDKWEQDGKKRTSYSFVVQNLVLGAKPKEKKESGDTPALVSILEDL